MKREDRELSFIFFSGLTLTMLLICIFMFFSCSCTFSINQVQTGGSAMDAIDEKDAASIDLDIPNKYIK